MIKVYVMYPNQAGGTFDMDYYLTKHMPMVSDRLGSALKTMTVDYGVAGGQPGTEAANHVITALGFDSVETYQGAFLPHAAEIQGDIPRFTNIAPTVQISEVKM
jgi:uncharacterized protein (TIGR02118 family)